MSSPVEDKQSTYQRILTEAAKLFAQQGFEGTSIRQIAKNAEVSLASTNYHFRSKVDLYKQILVNSATEMSTNFHRLASDPVDLRDTLVAWYDYLISEKDMIKNVHRMITSEEVMRLELVPDNFVKMMGDGPPGSAVIRSQVLTECARLGNENPRQEAIEWAVEVFMNSLIQWALKNSADCLMRKASQLQHGGPTDTRGHIARLVEAVVHQVAVKEDSETAAN